MLQTSMRSLRITYQQTTYSISQLRQGATLIQEIYDLETVVNIVKDEGQLAYPGETSLAEGMSLELRHV